MSDAGGTPAAWPVQKRIRPDRANVLDALRAAISLAAAGART
ncbi:MAG: hypothetical protein ACRDL7_14405 [Gaiellaceae bacterium]